MQCYNIIIVQCTCTVYDHYNSENEKGVNVIVVLRLVLKNTAIIRECGSTLYHSLCRDAPETKCK